MTLASCFEVKAALMAPEAEAIISSHKLTYDVWLGKLLQSMTAKQALHPHQK
jgi:hypothetical protein